MLWIGQALRQQRLRRPFGFVATPPTVCEWAPTGLGRSARFVFLATNVAYAAAAWSLQGWPRLGVGALAVVSTIFHCVQTGCGCLRGPMWTHRLSRCDIALASAVGAPRATIAARLKHRPRSGRRPRRRSSSPWRSRAGNVAATIPVRHARPLASSQCLGPGARSEFTKIHPSFSSFIIDVRHRRDIVFMRRDAPSPRARRTGGHNQNQLLTPPT